MDDFALTSIADGPIAAERRQNALVAEILADEVLHADAGPLDVGDAPALDALEVADLACGGEGAQLVVGEGDGIVDETVDGEAVATPVSRNSCWQNARLSSVRWATLA